MSEYITPKGRSWNEVEKELFTPEEIAASNSRVALMVEQTKAKNEVRTFSMKPIEMGEMNGTAKKE